MALTHVTALRTVLADAAVDQLDLGTPPAVVEIRTSGGALLLASLTMSNPAFGAAAAGVATAAAISDDTSADNTGTAAEGLIRQGGGTTQMNFSVTATGGGGDLELSSVSINATDQVSITSMTYTAPA